MKTKQSFTLIVLVILVSLIFFAFSVHAEDGNKQASGYYTTDLWLLGVTPFKPIALDHSVIPGLISQTQIRGLAGQKYLFVYMSDAYDVVISDPLVIVIFYINGMTSNIICLGDVVQ